MVAASLVGPRSVTELGIVVGLRDVGISITRLVAYGGQGTLYEAAAVSTGEKVAVKVLHKVSPSDHRRSASQREKVLREVRMMHRAHVVSPQLFEDDKCFYIVSEFLRGVDLHTLHLHRSFTENEILLMGRQIMQQLAHLHSPNVGIAHRDIKPENIMVKNMRTLELQLIDFGLSECVLESPDGLVCTFPGTLQYKSPELVSATSAVDPLPSDIWAAGCVLYKIVCGGFPFSGARGEELTKHGIIKRSPSMDGAVWKQVSMETRGLIRRLLSKNPRERPSARTAMLLIDQILASRELPPVHGYELVPVLPAIRF
ncbi:CDPK-related kinase 1 [Porphyridium purpureum]|uniref:CDPK-related kinase 1 n=1 Tax=Porphyridium purpureum TaxID=35688 RepID=A0A5J4Z5K5_PORPP|nr:CDPK-related kinase 1 [Porphyridium purpureum]|eukprot:POR4586..scf295_1